MPCRFSAYFAIRHASRLFFITPADWCHGYAVFCLLIADYITPLLLPTLRCQMDDTADFRHYFHTLSLFWLPLAPRRFLFAIFALRLLLFHDYAGATLQPPALYAIFIIAIFDVFSLPFFIAGLPLHAFSRQLPIDYVFITDVCLFLFTLFSPVFIFGHCLLAFSFRCAMSAMPAGCHYAFAIDIVFRYAISMPCRWCFFALFHCFFAADIDIFRLLLSCHAAVFSLFEAFQLFAIASCCCCFFAAFFADAEYFRQSPRRFSLFDDAFAFH